MLLLGHLSMRYGLFNCGEGTPLVGTKLNSFNGVNSLFCRRRTLSSKEGFIASSEFFPDD